MAVHPPFKHSFMETDRLILRPMEVRDAHALFEIKSDQYVTERYGQEPHRSIEETEKWVEKRIEGYALRDSMFWIITTKDNDRAIGSVCYWNFDPTFHCAELGYELKRSRWAMGIMSESLRRIISYGFRELGLHRIEALPLAMNESSRKVLTKLGFKLEETFRERVYFRGSYFHQLCFRMLEEEWSEICART